MLFETLLKCDSIWLSAIFEKMLYEASAFGWKSVLKHYQAGIANFRTD